MQPRLAFPCRLDDGVHGVDRNLELHHHDFRRREQGRCRRDHFRRESRVRSGEERGLLLVCLVPLHDERTRGHVAIANDVIDGNVLVAETRQCGLAGVVDSDAADERHASAEPRRRDGLIGRLPAESLMKLARLDAAAGRWKLGRSQDHVGGDASDAHDVDLQ